MIKLEPIEALALTLHHSPGVQALLVGSGISRAAGVPTGWEITLDLIRRLANVQSVSDESDWAAWYRAAYDTDPSYSEILDAVASAPAERRSIIHSYIEAKDVEDIRRPTKAHNAIARLVHSGAIKVILTTNFDRLLESALRDVGVEPTVIASDDALAGATPLVHAQCTVIKLHGDYLDARIRNTADELERYSPDMDSLLDRIFDEYGLIVAGWSGDWDTALRNAILRSASRRYPFYWAARGPLSELGQDLLRHKAGRDIQITDADSFFQQLLSKVEALGTLDRAHPESVALTVAEGRRLCRDNNATAEWSDLLSREVERLSGFVRGDDYHSADAPTATSINELVRKFVARSETLRRLVLVGVRWGTEDAFRVTLQAISALTFPEMSRGGFTYLISLRMLGASMCFHWAIGAALLREDPSRASRLANLIVRTGDEKNIQAVVALPLISLDTVEWKILEGYERKHTPHSDYFGQIFGEEARDIVVAPAEADRAWDDAEFMIAMEAGYHRLVQERGWFWVPSGRFLWRREGGSWRERIERVQQLKPDSSELKAGLFGGSPDTAKKTAEAAAEFFERVAGSWF
ncbi:MAG TPA: SIR2 family protein [Allosphingosinicella sp.]|nr:SIR2 family protein [Allosphingosinicella sp.]